VTCPLEHVCALVQCAVPYHTRPPCRFIYSVLFQKEGLFAIIKVSLDWSLCCIYDHRALHDFLIPHVHHSLRGIMPSTSLCCLYSSAAAATLDPLLHKLAGILRDLYLTVRRGGHLCCSSSQQEQQQQHCGMVERTRWRQLVTRFESFKT
jgi:hypothetical protein